MSEQQTANQETPGSSEARAEKALAELSASQEMYLKTIHLLCEQHKVARVKEIAAELNVTMSSVNGAIKSLVARELCEHGRYGYVDLTELGRAAALHLLMRYEALARFLNEILNVQIKVAENDACEMEHIVSPQTLDRINIFLEFVDNRSAESVAFLDHYNRFLEGKLRADRSTDPI